MSDAEVPLTGGLTFSGIVRIGDTVRRPLHRNSAFVHRLLRHFEAVFVGPDEVGDAVKILSDGQLTSAGRLIRRFHDATAGTDLAGGEEVVCHHDLGQHNIVFRTDDAVAIIDWDEDVAPGRRAVDFSHAVWCLAEIGEQGGAIDDQARRVRLVCDAYGSSKPQEVIDELEARFRRALAHAQTHGLAETERICSATLAWLLEHGPALRAQL